MSSALRQLGSWLLRKLGGVVLIIALGLATYGLGLFLRDDFDFGTQKPELLLALTGDHTRLREAQGEVEKRIGELRVEAAAEQQRSEQAERVLATLREAGGWWQKLFGDRAQQQVNAERRERMAALRSVARARVAGLQKQMTAATRTKKEFDQALDRSERRIQEVQQSGSRIVHYLRLAWDNAHWYVAALLIVWFFGPPFGKLALFYGLAPFLARRRPIRLAETMAAWPEVGESGGSIEAALWPGETLRVKGKFLQTSDDGLAQRTCWMLDWRHPLASIVCGLVGLVEMRHPHAGSALRVTLANADEPRNDLALVNVPEGASFVLRPSYLAGAIGRADEPLIVRRRWTWWRSPAWVTRQLCFFEFVGPCRLIVGGPRGVRIESLTARDDQPAPVRRTNRGAAIGFTPNLDYRPVRTEEFWPYFRSRTPLFDGLFVGPGFFLRQDAAPLGGARPAGRFWVRAWNAALKILGL
jgi:hypothetical protein